ncbi:MAG TPA: C25 family cysteine peptidase, partial [Kofleriaceae bacterium]|nr:C25 family cysteine peptidase [Kofleriaceae bacterium]
MVTRVMGGLALVAMACGGSRSAPPAPAPAAEPAAAAPANPVDYLVIGPRALVGATAPLVALRERQGHGVEILELESLGVHTRDTIRAAVAARAADAPGLRFVLLLGDPESNGVPSFPRVSPFGEPFLTDFPYAEAADDRVLRVGRIPARTAAELEGVVAKIVRYETEPVHGGWQRRINMFAGPAKFGIVVDALIERAVTAILEQVPYDFDVNVTFAKPESPYAYRLDRLTGAISEELGRGSLVTVYTGHGLPYALDSVSWRGQAYEIGNTTDLAPVRIPHGSPFFISLTCLTGA